MAEEAGADVFHARISAEDQASATLREIAAMFRKMGTEAHHVGEATEHIHHPHMWAALSEHVSLAREHFGELHASVGEVGEGISELLPAFAALGALGTFAELFEMTNKTAEAFAQLDHSAKMIGTTADHLQDLRTVAYLTDTSIESMDTGLNKLNKTIAESASGKNKEAAALFAHLHISLRDAKGQLRSAPEMFELLADSFQHTTSAAMRTRMAMTLGGRGAAELIPLWIKGSKAIHEINEEGKHLNFKPSDDQRKQAEEYADTLKKLHLAGGGLEDAIGTTLAPVLTPLIDQAKEFLVEVRPEVQAAIAKGGHEFVDFMQHVPWHQAGEEVRIVGHEIHTFVDAVGGAKRIVEVLGIAMALKGVMFLVEPIAEAAKFSLAIGTLTAKLGTELVGAWRGVGTAARAAGVEESAALALSPHGGIPGASPVSGGHGAATAAELEKDAARSARIGRAALRTITAAPVIGAVIEMAGTVPPMMKDLFNPDDPFAAQGVNRNHPVATGGRHDYGTPGTGRPVVHPTSSPDLLFGPREAASWVYHHSLLTGGDIVPSAVRPSPAQIHDQPVSRNAAPVLILHDAPASPGLSPAPSIRDQPPIRGLDSSIQTTITIQAPAWMNLSSTSITSGAVDTPSIVHDLSGAPFADHYPPAKGR